MDPAPGRCHGPQSSVDTLGYALAEDSPDYYYHRSLFAKPVKASCASLFKTDRNQRADDLDPSTIVRQLVISGRLESVTDQLLAFPDEVGPFETLLYTGDDWMYPELAVRSMELMATEVMPAISGAVGE